ncbi:MAG: D-alanyl-D-alanine carboxypeptidase family protein [Clostridiales bacterium]|nr:D-alanyl-D-alanine carboxypeptidase family protein [Clostridiales bacterium]
MLAMRAIAALAMGAAMMFESWAFIMPHQDPTDTLILVNKYNRAPAVPITLVKPDIPPTREALSENIYMQPKAAAALEELFAGAKADGLTLLATSGFRSYSTQKAIFERKLETMSEKAANASVAKPGYSEHQTGLAMDVEGLSSLGIGLVDDFGETPEGKWLAENCHEYGFIIRYPKGKTDITGYIYEPWHVRYVGKEAAAEIAALDVTLEEYILMVRGDRVKFLEGENADESAE